MKTFMAAAVLRGDGVLRRLVWRVICRVRLGKNAEACVLG